jgi:vancomycin resistance protein YoaR
VTTFTRHIIITKDSLKEQIFFWLKKLGNELKFFLFVCLLYLLAFGAWGVYTVASRQQPADTFPANVFIDDVSVTGKTKSEALTLLEAQSTSVDVISPKYTISADKGAVSSSSAELGVKKDYSGTVSKAFAETQQKQTWLSRLFGFSPATQRYQSTWQFDQTALREFIQLLKVKVNLPGQNPQAILGSSGNINTLKINPGKYGQEVDEQATLNQLVENIQHNQASTSAVIASTSAVLTPEQTRAALERAKPFVGKKIVFEKEGLDQIISDRELVSFLTLPGGFAEKEIQKMLALWQKAVDRPPQDAVFDYDPKTLKVTAFQPPRNGLVLNSETTRSEIIQTLSEIERNETPDKKVFSFQLLIQETPPAKTLASTNTLGIKERIGFGDSEYEHSIPGRIHNVSLTASRINNTIVKPGEEFSFVKTLGDVSAETGFKPAYVIKEGKTVLGDGGGVCQVSSTVFRAVLNTGLPITKRYAHSYRVSYYELNSKPGIDATVYAGDIDLRFTNDTGHNILIHTETFPKDLYMFVEIYGTSDGRTTEIVDHKTWDFAPAPPTRYQDDPSLPRGSLKQVDFAAAGIKASFTNVVKDKDGKEIRRNTFFSNYRPWQAVFLRGVG